MQAYEGSKNIISDAALAPRRMNKTTPMISEKIYSFLKIALFTMSDLIFFGHARRISRSSIS